MRPRLMVPGGIDLDIYVEMILMQNEIVIIYAHEHTEGLPRLPQ
jgi:hypothetical protein